MGNCVGKKRMPWQEFYDLHQVSYYHDGRKKRKYKVGALVVLGHRLSRDKETPIFQGTFEGNQVAVKIIKRPIKEIWKSDVMADYKHELREVENLRRTHAYGHSNIIRYLTCEQDGNFFYVAFELCQGTLEDYVRDNDTWSKELPVKKVLQQMTRGIVFLHSPEVNIVHRDLKPSNVLIHQNARETKLVIGDFGHSKLLKEEETSISGNIGSLGWVAPEIYTYEQKYGGDVGPAYTRKCDVFSLGCLFYYVVRLGKHPFGLSTASQVTHINMNKKPNLKTIPDRYYHIKPLIKLMLWKDASKRPSAGEILEHPATSDDVTIMDFLCTAANHIASYNPYQKRQLEKPSIIPNPARNWISLLPQDTKTYLTNYKLRNTRKPYNYGHETEVLFLLKAVRNCKVHYTDLPQQVQDEIGRRSSDHVIFWLDKFPKLLHHVYTFLESDGNFIERWREWRC